MKRQSMNYFLYNDTVIALSASYPLFFDKWLNKVRTYFNECLNTEEDFHLLERILTSDTYPNLKTTILYYIVIFMPEIENTDLLHILNNIDSITAKSYLLNEDYAITIDLNNDVENISKDKVCTSIHKIGKEKYGSIINISDAFHYSLYYKDKVVMKNETYFKVMYYIQNFIDKDTTDTGDYMIKAELKYNRNIFQFNPDRLGTTINL